MDPDSIIRDAISNSRIFFTADTHFGSDRHLELSKRPFDSVEEMDDAIVDRWNAAVPRDGLMVHLGDFGSLDRLDELNGQILLIPGNYDLSSDFVLEMSKHSDEKEPKLTMLSTKCHHVSTGKAIARCSGIQMVHEPSHADWNDEEFVLYAHCHGQKYKRGGVNVGVDCHHFRPLSMSDVLFWAGAVLVFYDEECFLPGRER